MVWDFAEVVITAEAPGNWQSGYELIADVVDASVSRGRGQTQPADATDHPLPDESASVWFTDPPYYDAVPYADLSDFFLVWLKRTLPGHPLLRDPFDADNRLSPKTREAVQDETKRQDGRPKDRRWFEETMARAFAEGRRMLAEHGVGSVVFAHKTTEGWEALLVGMIRGGWTITGSWPIATELGTRLRARDSAALATSIHLICRPRPADAPVGDWADVLHALPVRVAEWMARLQGEGVRGADLVFACIGPALELYSRYRAVETAAGRTVGLPEYLEKVWEVVGRAALETVLGAAEARARNGMTGALEEDARLTALFLWTLQTTDAGGDGRGVEDDEEDEAAAAQSLNLPFDVVRRFAQPMGIDLERWTGRVIAQAKGVVRLLPVAERAKDLLATPAPAPPPTGSRPTRPPACSARCSRSGTARPAPAAASAAGPASWTATSSCGRWPPPRSTACTPPCCCRRTATPMRCERCSRPSTSAAPTSCAWPTPCRRSIRAAPARSACSTPCCWPPQGRGSAFSS